MNAGWRMEREEAIFENENNSNLESESNNRQQLSSLRSEENGDATLLANEEKDDELENTNAQPTEINTDVPTSLKAAETFECEEAVNTKTEDELLQEDQEDGIPQENKTLIEGERLPEGERVFNEANTPLDPEKDDLVEMGHDSDEPLVEKQDKDVTSQVIALDQAQSYGGDIDMNEKETNKDIGSPRKASEEHVDEDSDHDSLSEDHLSESKQQKYKTDDTVLDSVADTSETFNSNSDKEDSSCKESESNKEDPCDIDEGENNEDDIDLISHSGDEQGLSANKISPEQTTNIDTDDDVENALLNSEGEKGAENSSRDVVSLSQEDAAMDDDKMDTTDLNCDEFEAALISEHNPEMLSSLVSPKKDDLKVNDMDAAFERSGELEAPLLEEAEILQDGGDENYADRNIIGNKDDQSEHDAPVLTPEGIPETSQETDIIERVDEIENDDIEKAVLTPEGIPEASQELKKTDIIERVDGIEKDDIEKEENEADIVKEMEVANEPEDYEKSKALIKEAECIERTEHLEEEADCHENIDILGEEAKIETLENKSEGIEKIETLENKSEGIENIETLENKSEGIEKIETLENESDNIAKIETLEKTSEDKSEMMEKESSGIEDNLESRDEGKLVDTNEKLEKTTDGGDKIEDSMNVAEGVDEKLEGDDTLESTDKGDKETMEDVAIAMEESKNQESSSINKTNTDVEEGGDFFSHADSTNMETVEESDLVLEGDSKNLETNDVAKSVINEPAEILDKTVDGDKQEGEPMDIETSEMGMITAVHTVTSDDFLEEDTLEAISNSPGSIEDQSMESISVGEEGSLNKKVTDNVTEESNKKGPEASMVVSDESNNLDQDSPNEKDDDVVLMQEIKKEKGDDYKMPETIRKENEKGDAAIDLSDVKTEVIVLGDEKEADVSKKAGESSGDGLGIQIAAVSGQQHQLHANASDGLMPSASGKALDSKKTNDKSQSKSRSQTCIVCNTKTRCKYNIVRNGDTKQLCGDICFKKFRNDPNTYLQREKDAKASASASSKAAVPLPSKIMPKSFSAASSTSSLTKSSAPAMTAQPGSFQYKTCHVCQVMNINAPQKFCNWKGLDFCGESCLAKCQATLNNTCSHCNAYIPIDMRASFCLKMGNDMRPFCKQRCYTEFKKNLKMCSYCQKDLLPYCTVSAKVGVDSKTKEFCSWTCVKKFEGDCEDVQIVSVSMGSNEENATCSVCKVQGRPVKHTVRFQSKTFSLCSDICLSAFQYTNKINVNKCDCCGIICTSIEAQVHFIQFEGLTKRFCSDKCVHTFRMTNRKTVKCSWCSAKKANFDMIERLDEENKFQLFCSLNCLSLYRVNLQAKSNMAVPCDQCKKVVPAQYHLTMSDASVRNFCTYGCVMTFQSQFTQSAVPQRQQQQQQQQQPPQPQPQKQQPPQQQKVAAPSALILQQESTPSHPHGTRSKGRSQKSSKTESKASTPTMSVPVISDVVSLASEEDKTYQARETAASIVQSLQSKGTLFSGDGKERIVMRAPSPVVGKNKSLQCRPMTQTKATSCKPHSQSKEVQTDESLIKSIAVPIPVPIYVPMPTAMYTTPTLVPMPIPIPIPVPIFIPTTRKSANGIMRAIKEIVERMPADPLEAELLMMAEAVASDGKKPGDSDTDSEQDMDNDFGAGEVEDNVMEPVPAKVIAKKREGGGEEDMIQMALRMAEEMSGPIEDLETSVEPSVVSSEPPRPEATNLQLPVYKVIDPDYNPPKPGRGRGTKRPGRGRPPNTNRPKRQRTGSQAFTEPEEESVPVAPTPKITEPPPDQNCRLKFTFGVNAWKNWVIGKNAELDKNRVAGKTKMRPLPTDILRCTMDELNYSLCLFIKEVRKPNGDAYSSDSIYYLCLGIQQYLYENGRIDNIFTDLYFQRFTDALHELLRCLQPKVNSQGQMLCRIEEEHLWESKQLGAHSPYILLNTLIYFHTKHFILKTATDHMSLSFAQILKHLKKGVPVKSGTGITSKNVSLRFYCLANKKDPNFASRKGKDGVPVFEVTENFANPLRCPVKLYEFFLSKCPESIKNRNDIFYPVPERSCVPDSPVWYSTQTLDMNTMDKMLTRVLLVREIQEAHLHAQAIYI